MLEQFRKPVHETIVTRANLGSGRLPFLSVEYQAQEILFWTLFSRKYAPFSFANKILKVRLSILHDLHSHDQERMS